MRYTFVRFRHNISSLRLGGTNKNDGRRKNEKTDSAKKMRNVIRVLLCRLFSYFKNVSSYIGVWFKKKKNLVTVHRIRNRSL